MEKACRLYKPSITFNNGTLDDYQLPSTSSFGPVLMITSSDAADGNSQERTEQVIHSE